MIRRRSRRSRPGLPRLARRLGLALLSVPLLYALAALIGSLVPVNASWREPAAGQAVYLVSNGVHTDLILPADAQGLDWRPLLPRRDFAGPDRRAQWIAFGMGERRVYLDTPRWRDIRARTLWAAAAGGERVMHVEWVGDPQWHARAIRLRPEEYRRLWAGIRASFALDPDGKPRRIDHPGYGPAVEGVVGRACSTRATSGRPTGSALPGSGQACGARFPKGSSGAIDGPASPRFPRDKFRASLRQRRGKSG
jgi:uncharacterized protein (TIGR02117 family)